MLSFLFRFIVGYVQHNSGNWGFIYLLRPLFILPKAITQHLRDILLSASNDLPKTILPHKGLRGFVGRFFDDTIYCLITVSHFSAAHQTLPYWHFSRFYYSQLLTPPPHYTSCCYSPLGAPWYSFLHFLSYFMFLVSNLKCLPLLCFWWKRNKTFHCII